MDISTVAQLTMELQKKKTKKKQRTNSLLLKYWMLKNTSVWVLKVIGCASWPLIQKKNSRAEEQTLLFEFMLYQTCV